MWASELGAGASKLGARGEQASWAQGVSERAGYRRRASWGGGGRASWAQGASELSWRWPSELGAGGERAGRGGKVGGVRCGMREKSGGRLFEKDERGVAVGAAGEGEKKNEM
ncbi:hypothetical protein ACOSQ2_014853 [Xanthoceras sorbifolium]